MIAGSPSHSTYCTAWCSEIGSLTSLDACNCSLQNSKKCQWGSRRRERKREQDRIGKREVVVEREKVERGRRRQMDRKRARNEMLNDSSYHRWLFLLLAVDFIRFLLLDNGLAEQLLHFLVVENRRRRVDDAIPQALRLRRRHLGEIDLGPVNLLHLFGRLPSSARKNFGWLCV